VRVRNGATEWLHPVIGWYDPDAIDPDNKMFLRRLK